MYLFFKRLFDIFLSFIALVCLSWLLIPIAIILLLTGEHYVFYFQERIGKGGKPFNVWKFATMLKNSPNIGTGTTTLRNDPRVLPFGKFLRMTKLNELPQLINILIGNMSIIGPRPMVKKSWDKYSDEVKACISKVKPGLSGIGSVIFRDEEYYISLAKEPVKFAEQIIHPHKGNLEIWYYKNRSLYVDFMIIFLTCWVILFPKSNLIYKVFPTLPRKDLQEEVKIWNEKNV
ncbi:MAG: sugar transferase [Bacteroidales bacterium]|nr:sugar transferase [Bacteroidales bacterium]